MLALHVVTSFERHDLTNDHTLPQALFQIALAILECNKRQLLEATDEGEAMCCLNEFMANISNKNHAVGKSYDENMVF